MANYDHPAYLARQLTVHLTTAGANGTSGAMVFPWDIDVHQVTATVVTAGTATGNKVFLLSGTSSIGGDITLSTSTAGVTGTSGNVATKIPQGTLLSIKNGTDATGVFRVAIEYNIAPSATWLGVE